MKALKAKIEKFFSNYTLVLERLDVKGMVPFYDFPCFIISETGNTVSNSGEELLALLASGVVQYKKFDFSKAKYSILSFEKITEKIIQVKVRYDFANSANTKIYDCDYWYNLKNDRKTIFKILTVISVNEMEKMHALMQKSFSNTQ